MKLVMIARHYPPAVSGGARRPYFLAHALKEAGAEIFLVAPDLDPALSGVAVEHPNRDPAPDRGKGRVSALTYARNAAREWLRCPDPDIVWAKRAAKAALTSLPFKPDWILTTSPPESVHWAGNELKRVTGARWCADFRDQWFERAFRLHRRNRFRRTLESVYARHLLRNADLTVSVNELIDSEISRLSEIRDENRIVIGHFLPPRIEGFLFEGLGPHLLHSGSFSMSDPECSIESTLRAFAVAAEKMPAMRLHLAGRLSSDELNAISSSPVANQITLHGVVSLEQSLAMQTAADALIVTAAPNAPVPPGKYVEYQAAGRPIIATGDGPWRKQIGLSGQDEVRAMQNPGSFHRSGGKGLLDAAQAANVLLEALHASSGR
jgi:glycosyltransferase involved in cell wall biosynthesis